MKLSAKRISQFAPMYDVTFSGTGKVLQSLLQKLKIARVLDNELKTELDPNDLDSTLKQILEGR